MRFVFAVLALVLTSLSIGSRDAVASPDGKRVALLGTSNANPYIGAWTKTFTKFATDAKTWGHPFFMRMDHEMNGKWYPWSEQVNGNQPGGYVRMWRHVHDIFTPRDYPESWLRHRRHLWNEQYLLESFLAFNGAFKIACSVNWLKHNHWTALTAACPMLGKHPQAEPGAFWFKRV